MGNNDNGRWKCRHCIFMKKDINHVSMKMCVIGGKYTRIDPGGAACCNFIPSKRAKTVRRYINIKMEAESKPNKKEISAKELQERIDRHIVRKPVEKKIVAPLPILPLNDGKPVPIEERTSAFREQMCAGRCCKRKEVCKHYASWIEHGKPKGAIRMIASVTMCINGDQGSFMRFLPMKGKGADDVKEFADI